ncbi:hypothetical protein B1810_10895 [Panacagrimonas perspica]|nr:hypothetical protein B1810_10895 [Panacagrimonas perspica]
MCGASASGVHAGAGDPASAFFVPVRLTPKEAEIFKMLRKGLTNDEIARRMFVTRNTVKFHLKQVYRKLGIRSRRRGAMDATDRSTASGRGEPPSIAAHHSSTCSA